MIPRYTRPQMGHIWSDQNKLATWLEVELAASETLAEMGHVPAEAFQAMKQHAGFDAGRIAEIEREVKHDVVAFTTAVAETMARVGAAEASRWLHYGLTSSDVVDTALALQLRQCSRIIQAELGKLRDVLRARAFEFRKTICIGRTHGMHAEPTTFGLKLAGWYAEVCRNIERFAAAADQIRVGKLSGAVGTFAHLGPEVEERVCLRLGLQPDPISSQIVQRDRHAHYVASLALVGATLEKIALEIRHLQRTEVREAEESFASGQKGSSSMPHKRNPVTCEQICGLARVIRGHALAAFENVALWHERDISHSSVERIILPDVTTLVDYLLVRTTALIRDLVVSRQQMRRNVELTGGLVFSGQLLLDLAARGVQREQAYLWVQRNAMKALETGVGFRELLSSDPDISNSLDTKNLDDVFSIERQLRNVDRIFERVFPEAERDQSVAGG